MNDWLNKLINHAGVVSVGLGIIAAIVMFTISATFGICLYAAGAALAGIGIKAGAEKKILLILVLAASPIMYFLWGECREQEINDEYQKQIQQIEQEYQDSMDSLTDW